jgi:hypothetical protein
VGNAQLSRCMLHPALPAAEALSLVGKGVMAGTPKCTSQADAAQHEPRSLQRLAASLQIGCGMLLTCKLTSAS